jgi:hypothetical protein
MSELVAILVIALVPASLVLAILTVIALGVAGLASTDLDERRLLRG